MHAVKIQFCRRELTDTHTNPYLMSLFTHAVSLGSSAAVSDPVPAPLMHDASGSRRDSGVGGSSCALQAPWIQLSCGCLPFHSAEAEPSTVPWRAGVRKACAFLDFLLGRI